MIFNSRNFFWLIIIGFSLVIAACSKGGAVVDNGPADPGFVPSDTTAPQISIYSPAAEQVFSNGSSILISGRITDDYGLYRGTIKMTDDSNGIVVMNKPYEVHGLVSHNFSVNHVATVQLLTNYTITISFEDHGYNTAVVSRKIKINP